MSMWTNKRAVKLVGLFCDTLHDVYGSKEGEYEDPESDPIGQLADMESRLEVAWCHLTVFAECLGPAFLDEVQACYIADPEVIEEFLILDEDDEETPPPSPPVN